MIGAGLTGVVATLGALGLGQLLAVPRDAPPQAPPTAASLPVASLPAIVVAVDRYGAVGRGCGRGLDTGVPAAGCMTGAARAARLPERLASRTPHALGP